MSSRASNESTAASTSSDAATSTLSDDLDLVPRLQVVVEQMEDVRTLLRREDSSSDGEILPGFYVGLAPLYGELTPESYRMMDAVLKVAIQATLIILLSKRDAASSPSWEEVMKALRQNPALEEILDKKINRKAPSLEKRTKWVLRLSNASDAQEGHEVKSWLQNLIKDEDVLKVSQLTPAKLAEIVSRTKAVAITSLTALLHKAEYRSQPLLDIGLLRFPSITEPHFRVYRIYVRAWVKREAFGPIQWDTSGIEGDYTAHYFRPCRAILDKVLPQVQAQAKAELDKLLGSDIRLGTAN